MGALVQPPIAQNFQLIPPNYQPFAEARNLQELLPIYERALAAWVTLFSKESPSTISSFPACQDLQAKLVGLASETVLFNHLLPTIPGGEFFPTDKEVVSHMPRGILASAQQAVEVAYQRLQETCKEGLNQKACAPSPNDFCQAEAFRAFVQQQYFGRLLLNQQFDAAEEILDSFPDGEKMMAAILLHGELRAANRMDAANRILFGTIGENLSKLKELTVDHMTRFAPISTESRIIADHGRRLLKQGNLQEAEQVFKDIAEPLARNLYLNMVYLKSLSESS